MDDFETEAYPSSLTYEQEVRALLAGLGEEIGFTAPQRDPSWIPRFLARLYVECGRMPFWSDPVELGEKGARLKVVRLTLPGRCGASTAKGMVLPQQKNPHDDAVTAVHELLHSVGKRLGIHASEADWWWCTAGFIWIATGRPEGIARYPAWFTRAIPLSVKIAFGMKQNSLP